MHFNLDNAVTPAGFTAAAFDVETKPPRFIAPHLGLVGLTVQLADRVKYGSIRSRVGSRRAADRRLVNINDFIDILHAPDIVMLTGTSTAAGDAACQPFIQNLVDKRAFS